MSDDSEIIELVGGPCDGERMVIPPDSHGHPQFEIKVPHLAFPRSAYMAPDAPIESDCYSCLYRRHRGTRRFYFIDRVKK